jgi:hypothetical protein
MNLHEGTKSGVFRDVIIKKGFFLLNRDYNNYVDYVTLTWKVKNFLQSLNWYKYQWLYNHKLTTGYSIGVIFWVGETRRGAWAHWRNLGSKCKKLKEVVSVL